MNYDENLERPDPESHQSMELGESMCVASSCSWLGWLGCAAAPHPCFKAETCPRREQGWLSPLKLRWGCSGVGIPVGGTGSSAHASTATLPCSQHAQVPV